MDPNKKPIVLVASTVYHYEELLDRIYVLLTNFGYEVWMSHKGTPRCLQTFRISKTAGRL